MFLLKISNSKIHTLYTVICFWCFSSAYINNELWVLWPGESPLCLGIKIIAPPVGVDLRKGKNESKSHSGSGQGFTTHTCARAHSATLTPYTTRVLLVLGWRPVTTAGPGMAPTNGLLFQSRIWLLQLYINKRKGRRHERENYKTEETAFRDVL
jgi:hypothetical protein